MKRHNGSQILSAPVEDSHFPHAADPLGLAQHIEFAFLRINRKVPNDPTRMRITIEQEILKFQLDLARRAGMRGTGPKLYSLLPALLCRGLAGKKHQDQNGCCNILK
jgi:hypothetical protein